MPPIKSRMMGQQRPLPDYRVAKNLSILTGKKLQDFGQGTQIEVFESSEKLKRLRIPDKLCKTLPSAKDFVVSKVDDVKCFKDDGNDEVKKLAVSHKLSKSHPWRMRFQLLAECEGKFPGIIWDTGFLNSRDIFICYGDGIAICDRNLKVKTMLDNIKLAGGAAVMPSGNFVAIDRFNDTVNIYSSDGQYISSFVAGSSPMNVAVNRDNFIAVTDIGDKCVRVFSMEGTLLNTIPQKGREYELQWPLYIQVNDDNSFIVSDVLQRKIFIFDEHGSYVKALQLKTYGANSVLRPHGICKTKDDIFFVVDNALDTIELFSPVDNYIQTVLMSEDGVGIKPKVLGASDDGFLVVGGMTGCVKLFKFIESDIKPQFPKEEQPIEVPQTPRVGSDNTDSKDKIFKTDLKMEISSNDCVIVID